MKRSRCDRKVTSWFSSRVLNDLKDSSINFFSSTVISPTKSRGYLGFILQHASMPNIKLVLTLLQKKFLFIMKTQFIFRLYKIDRQLSHTIFRRVLVCEGVWEKGVRWGCVRKKRAVIVWGVWEKESGYSIERVRERERLGMLQKRANHSSNLYTNMSNNWLKQKLQENKIFISKKLQNAWQDTHWFWLLRFWAWTIGNRE